jgi:hypothetical protein
MALIATRAFPTYAGIVADNTDLTTYPKSTTNYYRERGYIAGNAALTALIAMPGFTVGASVSITDFPAGVFGQLVRRGYIG